MAVRMIICNKIYTMLGFYDIITNGDSKYQFRRGIAVVHEPSDVSNALLCKTIKMFLENIGR